MHATPLLAQAPPAATPDPTPKSWLGSVAINGFAEGSYSYNVNHPDSRLNQLRAFDFDDRKLKLDVAELVLQRAVSAPKEFGFRIDAVAGGSVPRVEAAAGFFRDSDGKAYDFDIQQLFLSYVAPVGNGLRIDAGKWLTHTAIETIAGYDAYNDNVARSLLFTYAVPISHAGLKLSYPISHVWSAMVEVIEGWDVVKDNNAAKSIGAQLAFTPVDAFTLYLNTIVGPEQLHDSHDNRVLGNVVATWKLSSSSTLDLDAAWAVDRNGAAPGDDAMWASAALYARHALSPHLALTLRGEVFDDRNGVRTGLVQRLAEATLTPEIRITSNFIVRGDLRLDHSNAKVFEKRAGTTRDQPTMLLGALVRF